MPRHYVNHLHGLHLSDCSKLSIGSAPRPSDFEQFVLDSPHGWTVRGVLLALGCSEIASLAIDRESAADRRLLELNGRAASGADGGGQLD
jgi:hypothetical protein